MNDEVTSLSAGINLVPQATKSPQQVRHALLVAVLVLRYTLLLVGIAGLGFVLYRSYLSINLQNTTEDIAEQLAYISDKQEFQENFLALQTYADALGTIHGGLKTRSAAIAILEEITPSVIVLSDLTINQASVKISGVSPEYPAITDYFDQLSKSGEFENVQILNITRPTDDAEDVDILFTISADIQ